MNKKYQLNSSLDEIIWFICYCWLIIDTITGYFLNNGVSIPLSQLVKSVLLFCLIIRIIEKKGIIIFIISIILFFCIIFISSAFYQYFMGQTLTHFSKLLLTILLFIYFKLYLKTHKEKVFEIKAFNVFKIGFVVLSLNILLGLFGLGFHTYAAAEFGSKGFIYSGNEIGGIIVAIVPLLLYWSYFRFKKKGYLITVMFCITLGILLSTKSSILIIVLSSIIVPLLYSKRIDQIKIIIISVILIGSGIYYFLNHIDMESLSLIGEITYRYDKGGLIMALLSARNEFAQLFFQLFEEAPFFQRLFGMGISLGAGIDDRTTVEMDFLDILFYYGYIGLFAIVCLIIYIFCQLYKHRNDNRLVKVLCFSDIIMIGMAAFAGHILFSSMAGLYIALANSLMYCKSMFPLLRLK